MFHPKIIGQVRPPADLMKAAREGLTEEAFNELMVLTSGQPPTKEQLIAMADAMRGES